MSKIGEKPVIVPASVTLDIQKNDITVKGKLGELAFNLPSNLILERQEDKLLIKRKREDRKTKALHGLYRSLIANAVQGVETPWQKRLEIVGTGYNVKLQGENLLFKVGYSHQVEFKKVPGITYQVDGNNKVIVSGFDKYLVGETAYKIKCIKKPDVYKGKGIKYEGEKLRIKPGKKAKTAE